MYVHRPKAITCQAALSESLSFPSSFETRLSAKGTRTIASRCNLHNRSVDAFDDVLEVTSADAGIDRRTHPAMMARFRRIPMKSAATERQLHVLHPLGITPTNQTSWFAMSQQDSCDYSDIPKGGFPGMTARTDGSANSPANGSATLSMPPGSLRLPKTEKTVMYSKANATSPDCTALEYLCPQSLRRKSTYN